MAKRESMDVLSVLPAWILTIVHMVKPSKDEVYSNPCIDTLNQPSNFRVIILNVFRITHAALLLIS